MKGFFCKVWAVFSDAADTSETGTDTRSSWFPKRCRFGAGPSVITNFFNTRRAANKTCHDWYFSCVCMFVTSVCAFLRVCGEQLGVCIIDFDECVERERRCFVLLVTMEVLVLLLVSVWFQLSTKL